MMTQPSQISKSSETKTCLVRMANTIAKTGGIKEKMPWSYISL